MLDITKASKSYFFVKASSNNLANGVDFTFKFENILSSKITAYNNQEIEPNTKDTTLKNLTTAFTAQTVKGVEDITVKTKIVDSDLPFKTQEEKKSVLR